MQENPLQQRIDLLAEAAFEFILIEADQDFAVNIDNWYTGLAGFFHHFVGAVQIALDLGAESACGGGKAVHSGG